MPILDVRDLTVQYNGEPAIDHISFSIYPGDRVAIIGPNGAGKSTLLKAALGLIRYQSGDIRLNIEPEQIGYVPQYEDVNWTFPVTVRDVVMMGCARQIGWFRAPRREQWQLVDEALRRVGMSDLSRRQVGELSGGQRRRVFIARALAQQAELLILDEPFSGVDTSVQADLMAVLERLNADGLTILLSTHDLDLAFGHFSKVMALHRKLIAYGAPDQVFTTETLTQVYGRRLITWQDGAQVSVFVDDHHCADC